ncbi:hypothetical protein ID854_15355 [Xenorhabdus sp. M]|uniref:Uncharacterized protein n=1 Tax=Xenorhabdus szentirmaii TaxID=290112 RepID=A0AAW3YY79_9GAMM|nr:hypothetical protein [Xenorhabdus sp. M]MBD2801779.1 hypothetical protein [Xenorhabdus sp. M]
MVIEYVVVGGNNFDALTEHYVLKNGKLNAASPQNLAEICAKDYYDNHDGWGAYWPIDIMILAGGESLGVYRVTQEYNPTFAVSYQQS